MSYNNIKGCYTLSSWNYGMFSNNNPYFQTQYNLYNNKKSTAANTPSSLHWKSITYSNFNNLTSKTKPNCTTHSKNILREEDRIVTDSYLQSLNQYRLINSQNSLRLNKRVKSSNNLTVTTPNLMRTFSNMKEKERCVRVKSNNKSLNNCAGKDTMECGQRGNVNEKVHYKITYNQWLMMKNNQNLIKRRIKYMKKEEEIKERIINKKIQMEFKKIESETYKKWLEKKDILLQYVKIL